MRYDYRCASCGVVREVSHPMGGRPRPDCCLERRSAFDDVGLYCGGKLERVFNSFMFQEDRRRLWRNKRGDRFDPALGADKPESRREEEALLKANDQERVSWDEVPAHMKRAQEVAAFNAEESAHGGTPLPPEKVAAYVNEPVDPLPSVESQLDAIGYRRGGSSPGGLSKELDVA